MSHTPAKAPHGLAMQPLRVRRLGIDTQHEAVVFMHKECHVCRSEGFVAHTRVLLRAGARTVIATLYHVASDLVARDEAAYRYLAESIRMHPDQETLKAMMETAGLARVEYFNLAAGVVALHRGWKA